MLYQDYETEISQGRHLAAVFAEMEGPVCLLGGWAVFLTVNERFGRLERLHGEIQRKLPWVRGDHDEKE